MSPVLTSAVARKPMFSCRHFALVLLITPACDKPVAPPAPALVVQAPATAAPSAAPVPPAPIVPPEMPDDEALTGEAPEQDPVSAKVSLRLDVSPRSAHPVVYWGRQKLGVAPITIVRPRRSGPMDVVISASGFLDHHTRLFTDRDDRLSIALVRSQEATTMLGYKRRPDSVEGGIADGGVTPERSATVRADAGAGFTMPQGVNF